MKAHELGSAAITGALIRSNVQPEEVSDVIMGQVCENWTKHSDSPVYSNNWAEDSLT